MMKTRERACQSAKRGERADIPNRRCNEDLDGDPGAWEEAEGLICGIALPSLPLTGAACSRPTSSYTSLETRMPFRSMMSECLSGRQLF